MITNSLHTDTYYRGYRLAHQAMTGKTFIYYGTDHVDTVFGITAAKKVVDDWQNAR
jgi:hypothetical protein